MITLLTENVLKNILKLAVGEDCYQRMHLKPPLHVETFS